MLWRGQRGFTLVEMAVAVGVFSVLAVIASTNFIQSIALGRLREDAADLRGALQLAQVVAIGQRSRVVVKFDPQDLGTATEYVVFLDNGTDIAGAVTASASNNQEWDGCEVLLDRNGQRFGLLPGACTFDNLPQSVLRGLRGDVQFAPLPADIVFGSSGSRVQPADSAPTAVTLQSADAASTRTLTVTAIGEVI